MLKVFNATSRCIDVDSVGEVRLRIGVAQLEDEVKGTPEELF